MIFAGTLSASKTFKPFTDRLQSEFQLGQYHVSTVINLDAALWGSSGFVVAQVKSNKAQFPLSTMVLDQHGTGATGWQLGKKGALLAVMDATGQVKYLAREPLNATDLDATTELVRSLIEDSAVATTE